jgi:hypothetical protein
MEYKINRNQNPENNNSNLISDFKRPESRSRVVNRDSSRSRSRSRSLIKKLKKEREELNRERYELERSRREEEYRRKNFEEQRERERSSEFKKDDNDDAPYLKKRPNINLFKNYGRKFIEDPNFKRKIMEQSNEYPIVDRKCAYVLILLSIISPGLGTVIMSLMSNRTCLWLFIGLLQIALVFLFGYMTITTEIKGLGIFMWIWPLLTMYNLIKFNKKERSRLRFNLSLDK